MPQAKTKRLSPKKHLHKLHLQRLSWFAVLAVGLLLINVAPIIGSAPRYEGKVLAYATNVSNYGLLQATNAARAANGKAPLHGHAKLNNSAQAKANDMIAKDYWAHNSPTGTTPWDFFVNAGYHYIRAGENLAYGFDSSQQIVDAWMGSSGHRYNVLGDYQDVGFGIASGNNYQGGKYTVVVAHYGAAYYAPTPTHHTTTHHTTSGTTKSKTTSTNKPKTTTTKPKSSKTTSQPKAQEEIAPEQDKAVTNLDTLLSGQAGLAIYSSLGLIGLTSVGFASTHWRLVKHGWKFSKHFVLVHPALDAAVIIGIIAILLTSAAGFIK